MKTVVLAVLLLSSAWTAALASSPQAKCDPKAPVYPPDPVAAANWHPSPVLYISPDGVSLIVPQRPAQAPATSPDSMRSLLLGLAAEDWSQGCYVDIQEQSTSSESGDDAKQINRHLHELEKILDELGIRIRAMSS